MHRCWHWGHDTDVPAGRAFREKQRTQRMRVIYVAWSLHAWWSARRRSDLPARAWERAFRQQYKHILSTCMCSLQRHLFACTWLLLVWRWQVLRNEGKAGANARSIHSHADEDAGRTAY
eukprot:5419555-Pleurochrysis_carterae.AAC.2